ncbi:tRNA-specific adenosine deaminase 1 [Dendroctonus ponderosae]|uniref:tRNA-specific adenosine deaminase 1 n=1 Tax=Dendroctonus ponderosae TaxID=77166 RepID=U4UNI0_DENPD|nr:tRNA-specific adenosine deaminase 1 [Dendroctonus ponderosae]XP_019755814.2 tRNA-specific adenosine deaminase 1 [Dendroctonus ponderosae]XP_019755815.2 tRNA-specific adenosine deaminase 1 [Dendroctonus ponderosae]XP_048524836.1 tRNA-specific adenosine deaminase 1 [Dendroctonus ponderosae]XP_048524837.1 tRNA-specific adenosine deaminase 1 [Dendroctonus ponderosae]ERL91575.1 hypothetical protein D910_08905 [Dendroctonus ponderosae]
MKQSLGNKIAHLSVEKFKSLPKTGKPKETEWTILSSIVKEQNSTFEVVSIGTGSKCIGKTKMCPKGTIVNDSHAEVMCRRAFLRYLYSHLTEDSAIFYSHKNKTFSLKPGVKFHFFTTQVPCGDAAIFPQDHKNEDAGSIIEDSTSENIPAKKRKLEDIFRTGAKCLKDSMVQDPKTDGATYHVLGVVRTKPGRGDPTASVSCSDKLAKWCHLGIQGALLMLFLAEPVYLSSFTILKESPFCQKSLERALFERVTPSLSLPYQKHKLEFYKADKSFVYRKTENRLACSSSICWWYSQNEQQNFEVAVNGRKQGVTKKNYLTEKGRLGICKLELFKTFRDKCLELKIDLDSDMENSTYEQAKRLSKSYQNNWIILKEQFRTWTMKDPELLHFTVTG